MDRTYSRLLDCQEAVQKENKLIIAKAIKARFLGLDDTGKTLHDILDYHKEHMKDVLKPGTLKNYKTMS